MQTNGSVIETGLRELELTRLFIVGSIHDERIGVTVVNGSNGGSSRGTRRVIGSANRNILTGEKEKIFCAQTLCCVRQCTNGLGTTYIQNHAGEIEDTNEENLPRGVHLL
jgi:hypothetical protein